MSVQIMIQFNGKQLTIPINPEDITIERTADNTNMDIIGLGKTTRKAEPSLRTLSIESFFPATGSYFYTGIKPKTCVEFIEEIWNTENTNNNVAKIVTTGLPIDINMYFVIDKFDYEHKWGTEDDIYYNLSIKEYRAYGVKTVDVQLSGLASARAVSPVVVSQDAPDSDVSTQTYTVQPGDCLWNITKACTGNGAGWRPLYELNREIIGNNPDRIKPGQVLTLPAGWNTPAKVTKLKSASKSKSNKNSTQQSREIVISQNIPKPDDNDTRYANMQAKVNAYKSGIVIPTRR